MIQFEHTTSQRKNKNRGRNNVVCLVLKQMCAIISVYLCTSNNTSLSSFYIFSHSDKEINIDFVKLLEKFIVYVALGLMKTYLTHEKECNCYLDLESTCLWLDILQEKKIKYMSVHM